METLHLAHTLVSDRQAHQQATKLIIAAWGVDVRLKLAARGAVELELVKLGTNTTLLRPIGGDVWNEDLVDDIDDARLVRAEGGSELVGFEFRGFAVLLVQDLGRSCCKHCSIFQTS